MNVRASFAPASGRVSSDGRSLDDAEALLAACQAISAETNEAALLERSAEVALDLLACAEAHVYTGAEASEVRLRGYARAPGAPRGLDGASVGRSIAAAMERGPARDGSVLVVPLAHAGTTRGALVLCGADAPPDVARATALAAQISIGLAHAELYGTLEVLVDQEMRAAVEREQAMQLVLDSMGDGLLVCDRTGEITPVRSKAACAWFGVPPPAARIWDYLGGGDETLTLSLTLAYEAMVEGALPFEVAAASAPARFVRGPRTYALSYQQVFDEGVFARVLVSIVDVTEAVLRERFERAALELPDVIGHVMRDRSAFVGMLAETERLLEDLAREASAAVRARILHTLKGNTAAFGFSRFAASCHALEDEVAADPATLDSQRAELLGGEWREAVDFVRCFLWEDESSSALRVGRDEHARLLERLAARADHDELAKIVRSWTRDPLAPALESLAREAQRLGRRLGRRLRVVVDAPGRMPDADLQPLFAQLVHPVRNAVDHGIEAPDERTARGKPETATLGLRATVRGRALEIAIEDDGRGVDWSRVEARAKSLGLPHATADDLEHALFHDGLSTADAASDVSGRGVGMASLRQAVSALGGRVRVASEPGAGTRVICAIPLAT